MHHPHAETGDRFHVRLSVCLYPCQQLHHRKHMPHQVRALFPERPYNIGIARLSFPATCGKGGNSFRLCSLSRWLPFASTRTILLFSVITIEPGYIPMPPFDLWHTGQIKHHIILKAVCFFLAAVQTLAIGSRSCYFVIGTIEVDLIGLSFQGYSFNQMLFFSRT